MKSKYNIICPECGKNRPKTRQHRLKKKNGATLTPRNKKIECKSCQDFFDKSTDNSIDCMTLNDMLMRDKKLEFSGNNYYQENYYYILPAGSHAIVSTGSQVQSATAGMVGVPYKGIKGYPVQLEFVDKAPKDQDKIKVINTSENEGVIYLSTIVDKPIKKKDIKI